VAAILAIILGSIFYVAKPGNVKKSIEYGGGVKYVVEVNADKGQTIDADAVAESIYERIDSLGVGGADIETGHTSGNPTVTVEYPGLTSQAEKDRLQATITNKPRLVLTDIYGNPLFDENGNFNALLNSNPKKFVGTRSYPTSSPENFYVGSNPNTRIISSRTNVPLAQNGAQAYPQNGT